MGTEFVIFPATANSQITVPEGVCPSDTVSDVNVFVDVANEDIGQVHIRLYGPNPNKNISLVDNKCISAPNIQTTFDDEAISLVGDSCGSNPAIGGVVKPENSLSIFDYGKLSGTWSLDVTDRVIGSETRINNWALLVTCLPNLTISKNTDGAEPSTKGSFTITATPANHTGQDITGDLTYAGLATLGTDFTVLPGSFVIPDGSSSTIVEFLVQDDTDIEGIETVRAQIGLINNATAFGPTTIAAANIIDDDKYQISVSKSTDGAEPNTNGQFLISISPKNSLGHPILGTLAYSGTATKDSDYTLINDPATFSIPDGASSAIVDFMVKDDNLIEGTETVIATLDSLSIGSSLRTIITREATANLADNDTAPTYQLSIAKTADGAEPSTNGQFTVTVSPANTSGTSITGTVAYTGTATSDTDYAAPPTSFSIPNGSSTATLNFAVIDDTAVEGSETVIATISAPSTGTISTATATANLADNDTAPTYQLSIAKTADGAEPSTNGQFTVTVSPANTSGTPITGTVAYTGTATHGTDYTAPVSFNIPNGSSNANIPFSVINDNEAEGPETIIATINLTTPANNLKTARASTAELINLGNNSASAVINDDDTSTPIPIFSPFSLLALLAGLAWLGWRRKA